MRKVSLFVITLLVIAFCVVWWYGNKYVLQKPNAKERLVLFVPEGSNFDSVLQKITPHLEDVESFITASEKLNYIKIYPGRYTFEKGTTNKNIIARLKQGEQDEIEIMIGNYASIYELADKVEPFLATNSKAIVEAISKRPEAEGLDSLQMIYFLAPNTYRFHWTTSPEDFVEKLAIQYHKYWTDEKKELLQSIGLLEFEAITLASLVQLESYRTDEQPKVAGLYLNRLTIGMKLDADPTVIFVKKLREGWDKRINRVYYKDLNYASAYNTYKVAGLPPGPICMPNPSAIDAVLNHEKHNYIFFVADPGNPGYHLYAKTLTEQEKNARVYRKWVEEKGIK